MQIYQSEVEKKVIAKSPKVEVDKKVIAKTTNCESNFNCLKNNASNCCKVENCVNNEVYFISCSDNKNCNYKISFGFSYACTCPTRQEIYNKFKK